MPITADRILAVRTTKTVYRDGETVLKVFAENASAMSVMREAMNQTAAEDAGLPVPHLYEVTRMDGRWAIRSAYIRGKTLRQRMEDEPTSRTACLTRLAEMHVLLRQCREKRLLPLADLWREKIADASLSDAARAALLSALGNLRHTDTVCHGEFTPSNLILSSGENKIYILDWAHASCGDAAADAARTAVLLHFHTGGTDESETYLQSYCRISGEDIDHIRTLIPPAALSVAETYKNKRNAVLQQYLGGY